jgi:hypothetical protein
MSPALVELEVREVSKSKAGSQPPRKVGCKVLAITRKF